MRSPLELGNHSSGPLNSILYIEQLAKLYSPEVEKIVNILLKDDRFIKCSGSSKPHQHHYGDNGLLLHTAEVIVLCNKVRNEYSDVYDIDSLELFFAALFHDSGKMFDYTKNQATTEPSLEWTGNDHKRMIHHISRSGIIWNDAIKTNQKLYDKYFEKVLHAILSHHMCREAGSPVAPKSRVAWILTLCDNLSARMYDADSLDIITHNK